MIDARIALDAQVPISRGGKGEAGAVGERASVGVEVVIRAAVPMGFPMEIAVLDIHPHRQADITVIGQRFVRGKIDGGPLEA